MYYSQPYRRASGDVQKWRLTREQISEKSEEIVLVMPRLIV